MRRCRFKIKSSDTFPPCVCVCTRGCVFASRKNDKYTENISWFATNIATLCHSCQNAMTSIKHTAMMFYIFHMQIFERNRICINQHIVEIIWPKCYNVRWIFRRSQSKLHAFNWAIWFIVCSIPHRCTHLISIYAHINYLNTNSIMAAWMFWKLSLSHECNHENAGCVSWQSI